MTRAAYIEKTLRQLYGGYVSDDSEITVGLVNTWLSEGIAEAAKQNYKDTAVMDGIAYVNNGFYTTFKGLAPAYDEKYTYVVDLPEMPIGLGSSFGISTVQLKDTASNVSYPLIPISANQKTYFQTMRTIPNKTVYYQEGSKIYIYTTLILNSQYTTTVSMISGGDSGDLNSELNVPPDYLGVIDAFIGKMLMAELGRPKDQNNDGSENLG